MKLHPDYITHMSGDEQVIVATGESAKNFCGIARGNETTAFIVDCLKVSTTKDKIIESLAKKYNVDRDTVKDDVTMVIEKLNEIGAIIHEDKI